MRRFDTESASSTCCRFTLEILGLVKHCKAIDKVEEKGIPKTGVPFTF